MVDAGDTAALHQARRAARAWHVGLRSIGVIERRRMMTAEMRRIRREIQELGAPEVSR